MAHIKKFLFEADFDRPAAKARGGTAAPAQAEPPPPPPPTYGEEDLARARQEGYDAGLAAGRQEAAESDSRRLAEASERIAEGLAALGQRQEQANAAMVRQAVTVAMAAVRKMLPELRRRHGLGEIEALLTECVQRLTPEARVVVRVRPEVAEPVQEMAGAIAGRAAFAGQVEVMADDSLGAGDCRIDWDDGGAERNGEALWREIEDIVERYLGGVTPAAASSAPEATEEA